MRIGAFSEESYPLYNCTNDTLKVLRGSSDPEVVRIAALVDDKKRRQRFDVWVTTQRDRKDDVGSFSRWLLGQRRDHGRYLGRLFSGGDPAASLRMFLRPNMYGIEVSEHTGKCFAKAIEEWDRCGV